MVLASRKPVNNLFIKEKHAFEGKIKGLATVLYPYRKQLQKAQIEGGAKNWGQ